MSDPTSRIVQRIRTLLSSLSSKRGVSVCLWLVGAALAETFMRNGIDKFDDEGFWASPFLEMWGFPLWFLYGIGALETVSGALLLVPRLRHIGSAVLTVVMVGALATKSIHGLTNGMPVENLYGFFRDVLFFLSTISIFLLFITHRHLQGTLVADIPVAAV